jgi:hypothetical protein
MSTGGKPQKPPSKKTVALLDSLKRRRGERALAQRFLIVCEDGKSAPHYFQALKRHFMLSAAWVEVVGGGGSTQPVQVVERAAELKANAAKSSGGTLPFDQVWCVLDGDYGSKINNARSKASANGIQLAISTPCFEYWVLLHFEDTAAPAPNCDGVVQRLKKHIPVYEKGKHDFGELVKHVLEASRRAERLRKPGIGRGELPENQNPCSEVYRLINAMDLETRR